MTEPRRRPRRRVQRAAPEGVDPHPSAHALDAAAGEDRAEAWGDVSEATADRANEERLRRDKPPHWG